MYYHYRVWGLALSLQVLVAEGSFPGQASHHLSAGEIQCLFFDVPCRVPLRPGWWALPLGVSIRVALALG